jgi:hypothetical protein
VAAAGSDCSLRLKAAADAIEQANPGADPVVQFMALMNVAKLLGCQTRPATPASTCEEGHWIDEVLNDGSVILLEDGSRWLVDPIDRIETALWLPVSNIVVCERMLINTDDGEKAGAQRIS